MTSALSPTPSAATAVDGAARPVPLWAEAGLRVVSMAWAFTLVWMLLWALAPLAVGWQPTVVGTGSMSPTVGTGSVVHLADIDPTELGVGAIIAYEDPTVDAATVTHRIVAVETDGDGVVGFRTKGDANSSVDSKMVTIDDVAGVVRVVMPYAALPATWLADGHLVLFIGFLLATAVAGLITADTIHRFVFRERGRTTGRQVAAAAVVAAVTVAAPTTSAALSAITENTGNTAAFSMSSQLYVDTVDADSPIAHWRLGELAASTPSGSTVAFSDDFETFSGWNAYGGGTFSPEPTITNTGNGAGKKAINNDPDGAWKSIGSPLNDDFVLETWVYRPSNYGGDGADRFGLEDAQFNGLGVSVGHAANTLGIETRNNAVGNTIAQVAFDPPEDTWFRAVMRRDDADVQVEIFDGAGTSLAQVSAVNATTRSYDRFAVRGGFEYFVDDIEVTTSAATSTNPTVAVDRIGLIDGTYTGNPILGRPPLISNDPTGDTSVEFDPLDGTLDTVLIGDATPLNRSANDQRTLEAWIRIDDATPRTVVYEEGGGTNGMNLFTENGQLWAGAWSRSTNWSKDLAVSTPISTGVTHHVVVVLDATGDRTLRMYIDGSQVDADTKTDTGTWAAHGDDGAIGRVNGGTRFPTGDASSGGSFDGRVDEVAIYNSALSPARVVAHYNAGS